MAYDLNPLETLKLKKEVLTQAAKERWTLFFEHDLFIQSGTVIYQDDQYHLQ
jgi:hypothetical protein